MISSTHPMSSVDDEIFVADLLDQLTPEQARVLTHRFIEDRSIEETAVLVGRSTTAVKALQRRGIRSARRLALAALLAVAIVVGLAVLARPDGPTLDTEPVNDQETIEPEPEPEPQPTTEADGDSNLRTTPGGEENSAVDPTRIGPFGRRGADGSEGFDDVPDQPITEIRIWADSSVLGLQLVTAAGAGPLHGSNDGPLTSVQLAPGETITSINGRSDSLLDSIAFTTSTGRIVGPFGGDGGEAFNLTVPDGYKLVGLFGSAGPSRIDQVGVVITDVDFTNRHRRLISLPSGRCVDVDYARTDDGTNVILWGCHRMGNQQFELRARDGGHELRALHSGKCLDVEGASTVDGANVTQEGCTGTDSQLLSIDGGQLVFAHSGKCLTVESGQDDETVINVHQWTCDGRAEQQFRLE